MEVVAVKRFDELCAELCTVTHAGESWPAAPVTYTAGRLGVVLLSSGRCAVHAAESAASGGAGSVFLAPVPFTVEPMEPCHILCAVLSGTAPQALMEELPAPVAQDAAMYPAVSGLLQTLCDAAALPVLMQHFVPLRAKITHLHLCAFWPTREILTVKLTGNK